MTFSRTVRTAGSLTSADLGHVVTVPTPTDQPVVEAVVGRLHSVDHFDGGGGALRANLVLLLLEQRVEVEVHSDTPVDVD